MPYLHSDFLLANYKFWAGEFGSVVEIMERNPANQPDRRNSLRNRALWELWKREELLARRSLDTSKCQIRPNENFFRSHDKDRVITKQYTGPLKTIPADIKAIGSNHNENWVSILFPCVGQYPHES